MPSERRTNGDVRPVSSHLAGIAAVFIITAATGLGIAWLSISAVGENLHTEQRAAQMAVAEAVQRSVDRALAYGIPLTSIEGLPEYLDDMSRRIGGTKAIEVRSEGGFRAFGGAPGPTQDKLVLPLAIPGAEVAVYRNDSLITGVIEGLYVQILVIALAAALMAAALLWGFAFRPLMWAHAHLATVIDAVSRGDFAQAVAPSTATPVDTPLQEIRDLMREVNAHYAAMHFQAESLRAVDFDESLTPVIEETLEQACRGRLFISHTMAEKTR